MADNDYGPDFASLLTADEPTWQEQARARAQALRGRSDLGAILALTGDKAVAPLGQHYMGEAAHGQEQLAGLPMARQKLQLGRQQQTLHEQQIASGQRAAESETDPATLSLRRALGLKYMPDQKEAIEQAGAGALSATLPQMEKYAQAQLSKYSVNPMTGQLYDTRTGKSAPGAAAGGADPVKDIADAIERGDQPPDTKGLYKSTAAIRGELARRGFNLAQAQNDWQATQKHLSSLNSTQQTRLRQAVDATNEQLGNVDRLYEEWKRLAPTSGLKLFNRAALAASKQMPGETGAAAQQLESQIALLTAELGNVFMGGNSPTDHALKLASKALSADWNDQTFKSSIANLRRDLQIRANSMKHSTAAGLSAGNKYGVNPPPEQAPASAAAPASQRMQGKDGKWYVNRGAGWEPE